MSALSDENLDFLYETILLLQTKEEVEKYLSDLCTIPELKIISQRAVVAKMLDEKSNYQDIVEKTGASTATISRVNRSLQYGAGGYEIIFSRLACEDE
ncbi:MAG: YerC/YecD family TrpR-related protein [Acutalibacteraceae bacterium]|nr:YerC/YecD family TrpR-related protein [Oscillospiraceae bacterium]